MKKAPSGASAAATLSRSAGSAVYPSLAGKRVLVTGGGSGIGAGLVEAFARQGAETIVVDILEQESAALVKRLDDTPIKTVFHHLDITNLTALETFIRSLGGIDVLVNNAGNDDRHT
jgi:NAD(P)-dependent dehydrogenase (short-subunit alcohol dehydrogenase family)